jgi:hypothetical protein
MRDLEIVQFGETLKGDKTYFVRCGCKTFVFTDLPEMKVFLDDYLEDPDGYERRYYQKQEGSDIPEIQQAPPPVYTEQSNPVYGPELGDRLRNHHDR